MMWREEYRRNGEEGLIALGLCQQFFLEIKIDSVYFNIYLFQTSSLKFKDFHL